jgi:gluconokinase
MVAAERTDDVGRGLHARLGDDPTRDPDAASARAIVVMGVEGSGKSTVAHALAERLGYVYLDADWLHSTANREKMASGEPLDDDDRMPWLRAVGERMRDETDVGRGSATACSALKLAYRDVLRSYVPSAYFVYLAGPIDVVRARLAHRSHEFMPKSLLDSQYATLEPLGADEAGRTLDLRLSPDALVDAVVASLFG